MLSGEPQLLYRAIQELTSMTRTALFAPLIAACSLHVCQSSSFRNKLTKEVVDPEPRGPYFSKSMAKDRFNATSLEWENSKQCEDFIQVLRSIDLSGVKQIVAFACGSIKSILHREGLAR